MKKHLITILLAALLVSGCASQEGAENTADNRVGVRVQKAGDSKISKRTAEYPAMVSAEQEAKVVAKISGSAKQIRFKSGDRVSVGQELAKIDDVGSGQGNVAGFNASQVKQAGVAVEQAAAAYSLAQKTYQNLLLSSEKDLEQARIGKSQSAQGKDNLQNSSDENLKSAKLAYESAVLAREQAKTSLNNRVSASRQASSDAAVNAGVTADSVANTCSAIINNINNITGAGGNVELVYEDNLGALDFSVLTNVKNAYILASIESEKYGKITPADLNSKIKTADTIALAVKKLADAAALLFNSTITSASLPQSSLAGTSLSGLQSAAAGYQAQANGAISQMNGVKQALDNVALNNDSSLDTLEKAYELAKKQEESAKQNLENLKAGNKSALDSAGFGIESSSNQYSATEIRINSQLVSAKAQMEIAELSYRNALVALQGLYDSHSAISPIAGTITQKNVSEGETVSPGQILFVISRSEDVKLRIYVSQDEVRDFRLGQAVWILKDSEKRKGLVSGINGQPDSLTKRYLVEIKPEKNDKEFFTLGSVLSASVDFEKKAVGEKNLILSLSAIEIGQNGNYVKIAENGKARKAAVKIVRVEGESAEIEADLPADAEIITDGGKMLEEGDEIKILE